jgi:hypothetical protein
MQMNVGGEYGQLAAIDSSRELVARTRGDTIELRRPPVHTDWQQPVCIRASTQQISRSAHRLSDGGRDSV